MSALAEAPVHQPPVLPLGPDSVTWRYTSDVRLYLGAGAALLLQVGHPTVGAGVHDHSQFEREPWQRLLRTIDYLNLITYGDDPEAVAKRLRDMHKSIKGLKPDGTRYHALEPEAYAWVHATLIWAFVAANTRFGRPLRPDQVERMYQEMLGVGRVLGVRERDLPPDWAGFQAYFDAMVQERIERTVSVDAVLRTLERVEPPIPRLNGRLWRVAWRPPGHALRLATAGLLPPTARERFGMSWSKTNEAELRAIGAASRALTPVLPKKLRVSGPGWLRWREEAIGRGPLAAGQ